MLFNFKKQPYRRGSDQYHNHSFSFLQPISGLPAAEGRLCKTVLVSLFPSLVLYYHC